MKRFVPLLVGVVVLVLPILPIVVGYRHAGPRLVEAEYAHTAGDLVPISGQVAGTVTKVNAVEHQYVKTETVLVELDPTNDRLALAHAQARMTTARAQARVALGVLAALERAVSASVGAVLSSVQTRPPTVRQTQRTQMQEDDQATAVGLERAQKQVAAAQADARIAQAELTAAQRTVDLDETLLANGAIAAEQLKADAAAYEAGRARSEAAEAMVRQAQAQLASTQAARRQVETSRQAVAASERQDAHAEGLTRQAEAVIAEAQQRAKELAAAQAEVVDAEGAVRTAEVDLSRTLIRAPANGWVTNSTVQPGQVVHSGQALMSLSIPGTTWVVAGIKETLVGAVRAGDPARVTIDAHRVFRGRVMSIGKASGSSTALLLRDNATGSFIQVVRLIPVHIALDPGDDEEDVPAGLSAEVAIDTRHLRSGAEATRVRVHPQPAAASQTKASEAQSPFPAGARPAQEPLRQIQDQTTARHERLARITDRERRTLAQLDAESARIRAIILRSAPAQQGGAVPTLLNDGLLWPVPGEITSGYGWRIHPIFHVAEFHTGIDIAASWGTPIWAPADGTVIFTGWMPANGMLVILDHGGGLSTTYSHLSSTAVRIGDRVRRGQVIARIGSTGWSTGPHLFFEVRKGGRPVDPLGP